MTNWTLRLRRLKVYNLSLLFCLGCFAVNLYRLSHLSRAVPLTLGDVAPTVLTASCCITSLILLVIHKRYNVHLF